MVGCPCQGNSDDPFLNFCCGICCKMGNSDALLESSRVQEHIYFDMWKYYSLRSFSLQTLWSCYQMKSGFLSRKRLKESELSMSFFQTRARRTNQRPSQIKREKIVLNKIRSAHLIPNVLLIYSLIIKASN